MRISFIAALVVIVCANTVQAQCYEPGLEFDSSPDWHLINGGIAISGRVTNRTDLAIGGITLIFDILSTDRPMSLASPGASVSPISGGLLVGESIDFQGFGLLDDRSAAMVTNAETIQIVLKRLSISDQNMAPVELPGKTYMGLSEATVTSCG